ENHAFDDPAPLATQAGHDRARERSTEPVGDASEAAAVADLAPAVRSQHHVYAVTSQPGCLVEAVLGRLRQPDRDDGLDQSSLRRRATERQLEQDGLAETEPAEAADLCRHPQLELRPSGRAGDGEHAPLRGVDVS